MELTFHVQETKRVPGGNGARNRSAKFESWRDDREKKSAFEDAGMTQLLGGRWDRGVFEVVTVVIC